MKKNIRQFSEQIDHSQAVIDDKTTNYKGKSLPIGVSSYFVSVVYTIPTTLKSAELSRAYRACTGIVYQ